MGATATYRTTAIFGGIGLLAAAALLAIGWIAVSSVQQPLSPAAAAKAAAAARTKALTVKDRQFTTAFDPAMVRDTATYDFYGKDTVDVALVNGTKGADLAATARACLAKYLPGHEYAQCYVFDSTNEYQFKDPGAGLPAGVRTGLVKLCYTIRGSQEPGKPAVMSDMKKSPLWHAQGCPGW